MAGSASAQTPPDTARACESAARQIGEARWTWRSTMASGEPVARYVEPPVADTARRQFQALKCTGIIVAQPPAVPNVIVMPHDSLTRPLTRCVEREHRTELARDGGQRWESAITSVRACPAGTPPP